MSPASQNKKECVMSLKFLKSRKLALVALLAVATPALAAALLPLSVSKPSLDGRWRCYRGDPIPVAVTVTSNGKPVAGYPVNFFTYDDRDKGHSTEGVGHYYGTATTASNGVATLRFTIPTPGNADNAYIWAGVGLDGKYNFTFTDLNGFRVPIGRNGQLFK
jgi:hypothetical protein